MTEKKATALLSLPEFDPEASGALPKGWLGLLIGHRDAETSLFAKQFTLKVPEGTQCLYYTTYERTEDVKSTLESKGWEAGNVRIVNLSEEYFQGVLARQLSISQARERGVRLSEVKEATETPHHRRPYDLSNRLLADLSQFEGPTRIVLDSLDFLLEVLELSEVMSVARQIRHRAQRLGGQAILVLHDEIHERRVSGLLEDLADIVIELSTLPSEGSFEHRMSIRKVRNHPELKRTAVLHVTDNGFVLESAKKG